ncbi:MAG TPA: ATP-binding cassette domain-containing protein [Firmicutes bacterium]|nr:ATP-binding cassette domain-containing protein [Bacillota bacterium]
MTVREGLRFFAQLHGVRGPQLDRDIEKWIEKVALGEHAAKRVDELSKGNAQKVQFLVSLLHRPPLLVLDEPFAGLDPVNVRILKEAVRELADEGTAVLFSSHRTEHVEELYDQVCLIDGGRLVLQGTVTEVREATGVHLLRLEDV